VSMHVVQKATCQMCIVLLLNDLRNTSYSDLQHIRLKKVLVNTYNLCYLYSSETGSVTRCIGGSVSTFNYTGKGEY